MATLDLIDLGKIQTESQTKSSQLFNQPLPGSDSDEAILLDIFGVSKTVTIDGIITGNQTVLRTFITSIESIQNGSQEGSDFVSTLVISPASIKVLIENFSWNYSKGTVNSLDYSLELKQGTI